MRASSVLDLFKSKIMAKNIFIHIFHIHSYTNWNFEMVAQLVLRIWMQFKINPPCKSVSFKVSIETITKVFDSLFNNIGMLSTHPAISFKKEKKSGLKYV